MKTPEEYLVLAKQDAKNTSGKLKVFFGMSPGVGKTYAMLKEAQRMREEGKSVLVGIVETHGRFETEQLLDGLEILPLKKIHYRDKEWDELDTETILKRKPEFVLVDELAHTNIPGSLHKKRYQDVFEILEAGIHVLTTVNVQHLESQVNLVEKTLLSPVKETIPDSILQRADELVLIDIIPDELLKRLKDGKVYLPEKIEWAKENFFKEENLTYLRELSLNYTARFVEKRLPQGKESLLVAISASPSSKSLLRQAKRLAIERNSELVAIFTEAEDGLSPEEKKEIRSHINLAKELGAEVVHSYESDPVIGIVNVAREKRINRIMIGRNTDFYRFSFFKKSVPNRLIGLLQDVEIIVVPIERKAGKKISLWKLLIPSSSVRSYLSVSLLVGVLTFANSLVFPYIGYWPISILYLFFVALSGVFYTRGPVLVAALLSAFLWNYLFIPPRFTFFITKLEDLLMFFIFIIIALVNGSLTAKLKKNEVKLRSREEKLSILYELTATLSQTSLGNEILKVGDLFFKRLFPFPVRMHLFHNGKLSPDISDPKELAVALWVIKNGKPAGRFTDTLPLTDSSFYPLLSPGGTTGVITVQTKEEPSLEQEILLNTIANQVSIALERDTLSEDARKNYLLVESEKLYNLLFNSLSHELKTPLTAINGSATALMDPEIDGNQEARRALIEEIQSSALILNLLLGNLLDISRIESGHLALKKEKIYPNEIISDVISYLGSSKEGHQIITNVVNPEIPLILDRTFFGHAIFNLVYNACLYSPRDSKIMISVEMKEGMSVWKVEDEGMGLPEDSSVVFQKFFRGESTGKIGTGLGLAITKSIIELHGGNIVAENRKKGGACFQIEVPFPLDA
ncbi:two-component sensor histidine kinase [Leptospira kobayashii]|uniref:histidine kinase n=1 Tax=Leptospira kobayashii TaxID=1917830 RepID=A0ABM7UID8_9LEPT|nr:sensor histidine kinase KdpD [Leptospira kobayashii]BDA78497.1 two-component sensor histidine kinase [Leptospira kobayashii]